MKVYIMRHGEAELIAPLDSERRLTEYGKHKALQQGKKLAEAQIQFDKVLVSPYVRAQQTFEQVNLAFNGRLDGLPETWEALTPDGSSVLVKDYLEILAEQGINNLLIVSHLPLVGEIADALCESRPAISFATATIALIDWQGKTGMPEQIYYP